MTRYKLYVEIGSERLVYRRYGKNADEARKEFDSFMKERMPGTAYVVEKIEKDKSRVPGESRP